MNPRRDTLARVPHGFTLVEVLVALVVMAVLAAMSWQGVDAMMRSRQSTQASIEHSSRLATVITQWDQDLQALYRADAHGTASVPTLGFDGQTLRLVRLAEGGVQIVAWSLRNGVWMRWTSPVVTRIAELQDHWLRSQQLLGNEPGQLRLLEGVTEWQVYYWWPGDGRWTNAQSTGNTTSAPGTPAPSTQHVPDGVQLVLSLPGGKLTRDVIVVPQS